ncbi:hypothetical protein [Magnetospirillum aberrantis]|uniref:Uncharacterized protein n=1 Tax=Magnetospirillum aberrantis SpK TaxID=908842 RepID=A0A7C9QR46_9PROT|nr:hypothetical protein [Magnetospirillum aberrantis]NFV78583.1 hypothetical protein [Magnetospirillum aberrantis SpK]
MSDDKPSQDFAAFVDLAEPTDPPLPLTHTTDLYRFRSILETRTLQPRPCKVFGESLLYLFYGRPAYRPNQRVGNTSQNAYRPVCLLLGPSTAPPPRRAYPFDSGAFAGCVFERHMHNDMELSSFELFPLPDSARKVVSTFFGDNRAYYHGQARPDPRLPNFQFEAQSYHSLVADKAETPYDGRRGSVELQMSDEIKLMRQTVLAVALPNDFCDEAAILETIVKDWGADLLPYPSYHASPAEDVRGIFDVVAEYLKRNHYFGRAP